MKIVRDALQVVGANAEGMCVSFDVWACTKACEGVSAIGFKR